MKRVVALVGLVVLASTISAQDSTASRSRPRRGPAGVGAC